VRKQVRQDLVSPTCTLDTCTGVDANATAERRTDEVVECLEQSGNVCFRVEQAWSAVAVADTSTLEVLTGRCRRARRGLSIAALRWSSTGGSCRTATS
jgi:hypothetical protein